jgi:hypothetical protein
MKAMVSAVILLVVVKGTAQAQMGNMGGMGGGFGGGQSLPSHYSRPSSRSRPGREEFEQKSKVVLVQHQGRPPKAEEPKTEPKAPPVPEEAPRAEAGNEKLTRRTGEASVEYESSLDALRAAYRQLEDDFKAVPATDRFQRDLAESAKLNAIGDFLGKLGQVGDRVLADVETLKRAYARLRAAAQEAAVQYEATADYLRGLAREAKYPESKAMYERAADWYAARSKKVAHEASLKPPTDYESERAKLEEMVETIHRLERVAIDDRYAFRENRHRFDELTAFADYYRRFGRLLQQDTSEILKAVDEAEKQAPASSARPPSQEPRRPGVVLAGFAVPASTEGPETAGAAAEADLGGRRPLSQKTEVAVMSVLGTVVLGVFRWALRR